ncbi:MBL fold metallo-hydrolase [Actinokineospora sp. UTMC 2448]|uniref:MBL fold metallo-hydrolase n=1 Tax=Actinokineospora sp. UTMC 2448 TaxID=2268449 RepID=UPI002164A345|nr:MBL fold metallo-hydrolase [Actinokineospora sp. UTMC 2448]UVS77607.1 Beta-lactamase 2 precursor [Actinokineospora sp. UTMC 2448]
MSRWIEIADGVHARRHTELDQTLGLVVGHSRALVIDTGTDETHGAEFAAAIRELTDLPWTVVITHAHFDHFLGTAAFGDVPVYAHPRCGPAMTAVDHRGAWARRYREQGKPELAERVERARIVLPTHEVDDRVDLDLGGRRVTLLHPGLAHTDHDVAVHVPDAHVVFAGDMVEEGAPPSIGDDAHPARWPGALDVLLALRPTTVVPGHGEPVDPGFVAAQRDAISAGST